MIRAIEDFRAMQRQWDAENIQAPMEVARPSAFTVIGGGLLLVAVPYIFAIGARAWGLW